MKEVQIKIAIEQKEKKTVIFEKNMKKQMFMRFL